MNDYWEKELKEAVWNNRPDLIKICIDNGVDVNQVAPGSMGRTQLFVGVIHSKFDAVKCLLEAGADPNFGDDFGKTPLQFVKSPEQKEFLDLLKNYGAE